MKDYLKQTLVKLIQNKIEELNGIKIYDFASKRERDGKIEIMPPIGNLERQICIPTPAGPRFFLIKIQEKY